MRGLALRGLRDRAAAPAVAASRARLVQPEPLLRAVTDPRLQDRIDPGHQRCGVSMRLAAAWQGQRRRDGDAKTCANQSLNPERQHVAVETERQNSEGRRGHRRAAKERYRDAVIHLLVRKQAQMRAAAQRRNRVTCGYCALRNDSPRSPRNRAIMRSISGLLRAR